MSPNASGALHCIGERQPSDRPPTVRLCFALPPQLVLRAQAGRYMPTLHGVRLDVGHDGLVTIGGYDGLISHASEAALDQALRFLAALGDVRALPPCVFAGEIVEDEVASPLRIAVGARAAIARSPINRAPLLVVR